MKLFSRLLGRRKEKLMMKPWHGDVALEDSWSLVTFKVEAGRDKRAEMVREFEALLHEHPYRSRHKAKGRPELALAKLRRCEQTKPNRDRRPTNMMQAQNLSIKEYSDAYDLPF